MPVQNKTGASHAFGRSKLIRTRLSAPRRKLVGIMYGLPITAYKKTETADAMSDEEWLENLHC